MPALIPASRPQMTRPTAEAWLHLLGVSAAVAVLAVRGYYLASMGDPRRNDRGLYDDAIFIVAPGVFAAFKRMTATAG